MTDNDRPRLSSCIPRIDPEDVRRMREANAEFAARMQAAVEEARPAVEQMGRDVGALFSSLARRS